MKRLTFWLWHAENAVRFEVISDLHWKVVEVSGRTGPKVGDEVSPVKRISWHAAMRRVNSRRSSMSPNHFVLLRGEGWDRSDSEVKLLLRDRPWDPDRTPAA